MSEGDTDNAERGLRRRDVLRATGGALAVGAFTGTGSANDRVEVNVGFANPAGRGAAMNAAASVKREFNFDAMTIEVPAKAAQKLQNNPNIRYVEENGEMHALAQTTPWGIDRVDADVAHGNGETGNGADIAILDTGIDSDHNDLADNIAGGQCFADECCGEASGGFFCGDNDNTCNHAWDDDNDHGTHCAGTADAVDDSEGVVGVSTEANLWAGKVLNGCGSGSYSNIAAGIEWAADQGFDVASMSLGGDPSSAVQDACTYAHNNGVLLVAAAGNDGACTDCVGYPAAYSEVIAVSATSEDDSLASFSSTGPEVELAAPGENVLSTVPTESSSDGLDTFSGTSMATPHVAGAGGQLMANGYSNTDARQQLQDTAEDIGLGDNEQGNGLLDVAAALDGGGGGNTAPAADSLSASEVETDNTDAEFDASWQVSDSDGNLDSVELTLTDDTDGGTEDSTTVSVSGSSASDTTRLVAAGDDGSGNDYTVSLTVTDTDGASDSSTTTVSETEETNSPPAVDSLSASEVETDNTDAEFDASWQVSDADGNLSSVDLTLTDDTDGETEDTASVSVSGDAASGTTRLVAAGDDGSGNDYTVDLTVTDGDGASSSDTAAVSETEETNTAPAVDSLSASEVETDDTDAEFDASWQVSDSDGNLSSVDLTLTDDTDGETEDTTTVSVSGDTASGTTRLVAAGDDGSGNNYTVDLTVTDGDGASDSSTTTVSETEETNSAPVIDQFSVSTRSTGPWSRARNTWAVSDADGDLDTVTTELLDGSGAVLDSASSSASGSSASGEHKVRTRDSAAEVQMTVTDANGNETSDSQSV